MQVNWEKLKKKKLMNVMLLLSIVTNLSCPHPALLPWQEALFCFSQQHETCPSKYRRSGFKIPLQE